MLQRFHAGRFDLDLTMLQCRLHQCPIHVRLVEAGRVVDHVALPIPATSRRVRTEKVDADWGADPGLTAWCSGFETAYVSTVGRLIRMAPRATGLLITQRRGFAPVQRAHLIVLPRHGRLRVVWKSQPGTGATWSATYILSGAGRVHDVAYLQSFLAPIESDAADRIEAVRLSWNAAAARIQESELPARGMPLYLLRVGRYDSFASARLARSSYSFCLSPYWVLDGSAFSMTSGESAFIGKVYTQRSLARAAARAVKSCLPNLSPVVLRWTARR